MMWEKPSPNERARCVVRLGLKVDKVNHAGGLVRRVATIDCGRGRNERRRRSFHLFHADQGIRFTLVQRLRSACWLPHSNFVPRLLTVGLIINKPDLFEDNSVYIHSPDVKVGRIQNFKNWKSRHGAGSIPHVSGLEYFVQAGMSCGTPTISPS